jgi:4-hydroxybenzoate polyprenyltransferase
MTSPVNTKTHTDIKRLLWIERLPVQMRPYAYLMRIDRPIGIWLLLLPGLWSIFLSNSDNVSKLWASLLFTFGAVVMRAAGCIVNDLWDRDLDRLVERTRSRPIASGAVTVRNAIIFLATLLLIGLLVLVQFNAATIILGILTLPLILAYPLMKRVTWWPQAFLGLTFNFGALMGWSAMTGTIGLPAILLYIGGIFWTLGYDTVYAHQDKEDDLMAGIKSTALKFGDQSKAWIARFYAAASACFFLALMTAQGSLIAILFMLPMLHLAWQVRRWNPQSPESSLAMFKSNRDFGLLFLAITFLNVI